MRVINCYSLKCKLYLESTLFSLTTFSTKEVSIRVHLAMPSVVNIKVIMLHVVAPFQSHANKDESNYVQNCAYNSEDYFKFQLYRMMLKLFILFFSGSFLKCSDDILKKKKSEKLPQSYRNNQWSVEGSAILTIIYIFVLIGRQNKLEYFLGYNLRTSLLAPRHIAEWHKAEGFICCNSKCFSFMLLWRMSLCLVSFCRVSF